MKESETKHAEVYLFLAALLGYFVLYGPQPLLPLFAKVFAQNEASTALVTTAAVMPLSIVPFFLGAWLEGRRLDQWIRFFLAGMGVLSLGLTLVPAFSAFLFIRLMQGVLLSALLVCTMSIVAQNNPKNMRTYVSSTILGGFLGRVLSDLSAAYASWKVFFVLLAFALMAMSCFPFRSARALALPDEKLPLRQRFHRALRGGRALAFASCFCLFFTFMALLNFLPFRLQHLHPTSTGMLSSLFYSGYLLGLVLTLFSHRIARWLGSYEACVSAGFAGSAVLGAMMLSEATSIIFVALIFFCSLMFLTNTALLTLVNRGPHVGSTSNGIYLFFYYLGGTLGSYLPGFLLEKNAWSSFVALLVGVEILGLGAFWAYCRQRQVEVI